MNKILEISDFKVGDMVWFCYFQLNRNGNIAKLCRPILLKITNVSGGQVSIDRLPLCGGIPYNFTTYNKVWDDAERIKRVNQYEYLSDINLYFAFSKEESKKKFNRLIEDYIYFFHGLFKIKEDKILNYLL